MATARTKPAPPPAEPEGGTDPPEPASGLEGIEHTVRKVIGELFGDGTLDVTEPEPEPEADGKPMTAAQVEAIAARTIRKVQDDTQKRAPKKEEKAPPSAPEPETPPQRVPWLQRFLWGES